MEKKLLIKVEADNERELDGLTENLFNFLQGNVNETHLERKKEDLKTMDLGSVLAIVLGSGSITILARGIADWIGRNPSSKITITDEAGKLSMTAEGVASKDTIKLTEVFKSIKDSNENS